MPVVVDVLPPLGTAAFASVAGAPVGVADAVGPHSAFRNSLQLFPCNVPADCAALYLTLHSFIVRPLAEESDTISSAKTASVATHDVCECVSMRLSLALMVALTRGANSPTRGSSQRRSPGCQRPHAGPR